LDTAQTASGGFESSWKITPTRRALALPALRGRQRKLAWREAFQRWLRESEHLESRATALVAPAQLAMSLFRFGPERR
jgi:hypothetical protein